MATAEQRREIEACIKWYQQRNLDWSQVVEFLIRKANDSLPHQERDHYFQGRRQVSPRISNKEQR